MFQFPRFEYSKREVRRAGEIIAGDMQWTEESAPEARRAFLIANNWRDAHAFPMRSLRHSIIAYMGRSGIEGVTAARLKRMPAIRGKLRRVGLDLNQLQDLGGCRVILPAIADVQRLVAVIKRETRHELRREDDYIARPKQDGYRSHHMIFGFRGRYSPVHDGRRIELQVRTQLQHSWATTIEAVGLFRGEQLKNHQGSPDWLRFFELMSAEFAQAECCPVAEGCPDRLPRLAELRRLADSLGALRMLDSVGHGMRGTDLPLSPGYRPTHYLIRFDHATKMAHVTPQTRTMSATKSYDDAENVDIISGKETGNLVLVAVDKIELLKVAYPNYFGDVELFKAQLRRIISGKSAAEFVAAPRQPPPWLLPVQRGDLGWLRGGRFPKPRLGGKKD